MSYYLSSYFDYQDEFKDPYPLQEETGSAGHQFEGMLIKIMTSSFFDKKLCQHTHDYINRY